MSHSNTSIANKIKYLLYEQLDYMYCDNCRFSTELEEDEHGYCPCDDCHRKYNGWALAEHTAEGLTNMIMKIIADEQKVQ